MVGVDGIDVEINEPNDVNTLKSPSSIEEVEVSALLPIDAHADRISEHISRHRITVIQVGNSHVRGSNRKGCRLR